jgi:hypothetical protein
LEFNWGENRVGGFSPNYHPKTTFLTLGASNFFYFTHFLMNFNEKSIVYSLKTPLFNIVSNSQDRLTQTGQGQRAKGSTRKGKSLKQTSNSTQSNSNSAATQDPKPGDQSLNGPD